MCGLRPVLSVKLAISSGVYMPAMQFQNSFMTLMQIGHTSLYLAYDIINVVYPFCIRKS